MYIFNKRISLCMKESEFEEGNTEVEKSTPSPRVQRQYLHTYTQYAQWVVTVLLAFPFTARPRSHARPLCGWLTNCQQFCISKQRTPLHALLMAVAACALLNLHVDSPCSWFYKGWNLSMGAVTTEFAGAIMMWIRNEKNTFLSWNGEKNQNFWNFEILIEKLIN